MTVKEQAPVEVPAHSLKPLDPKWVITIREKLVQARAEERACPWARQSVYRVPEYLGDGNEHAYYPQVVSIGPLHHGKHRLPEMEPHKWCVLYNVLVRTCKDCNDYFDALRPMEGQARACYDKDNVIVRLTKRRANRPRHIAQYAGTH